MKRIIFSVASFMMCMAMWAQQALWGGTAVVSPEINSDNTVTFRLKAPKAVSVQITGDFLPSRPDDTPRVIWEAPGIADLKVG